MFRVSRVSKVVGILSTVVAIPMTMLSGLALTNIGVVYVLFVVFASLVLGVLAAFWFQLLSKMLGVSRVKMCIAGALSAVATALAYVFAFSVPASIVSRSEWLGTLMLYTRFTVTTFLPVLFVVGALVGLIASARRFAS
jgi:hypothetical protein